MHGGATGSWLYCLGLSVGTTKLVWPRCVSVYLTKY